MKETGIIMSGNHPKLIQAKLKTMTRRTQGLNEINEHPDLWQITPTMNPGVWGFYQGTTEKPTEIIRVKCPYGQVGDRLWVRETWRINAIGGISYQADEGDCWIGKWKPSIHMFRKDSRITLEITEVRAERVQEITPLDAVKEGCLKYHEYNDKWECIKTIPPVDRFHLLWDSLNAKRGYGFDFNPWVWPINFKKEG